jgi:hypothetical protein
MSTLQEEERALQEQLKALDGTSIDTQRAAMHRIASLLCAYH